jgi:cell wall-associated NlpC family hydrolase
MKTNPRLKSFLLSSIVLSILFGLSVCSSPDAVADDVTISRSVLSGAELRETVQSAQAEYKIKYDAAYEQVMKAEADRIADPESVQSKFVAYAVSFQGTPYWYGGSTTRGFDCSGFVKHVLANQLGIDVRHSASSIMALGPRVDQANILPGDLVGWGWGRYFHHVGIYIGDGKVIDALNPYRDTYVRDLELLNSWLGRPTFVRVIEADRNFDAHQRTLIQMEKGSSLFYITID